MRAFAAGAFECAVGGDGFAAAHDGGDVDDVVDVRGPDHNDPRTRHPDVVVVLLGVVAEMWRCESSSWFWTPLMNPQCLTPA